MHINTLKALAALAAATALLAAPSAQAATATVTVSGGAVSVSPAPVSLPPGDRAVVFSLTTRGYVISAISVPQLSCTISADGSSATCRRASDAVKGRLDVQITVQAAGGGQLPNPSIWIQAN